ncbi:MAG: alpha/beta hydrolase family protein [Rhizobiaceae bacterium]
MKKTLAAICLALTTGGVAMAENRIDLIRPDAPALAAFGDHPVGVRTIDLVNPDQIDIVNVTEGEEHPRYDRELTVEVWYPAAEGAGSEGEYEIELRDGVTMATIRGRGIRDADPAAQGDFPLVILSHGFPGNRFLMAHLAENLASKGYVVAAIDHRDSTYSDQTAFGSTLVNRPLDQLFVLSEIDRLSEEEDDFLSGLVDADRTGIVGYSMGGYGAIVAAGGGVTEVSTTHEWGAPDGTLRRHMTGSDDHAELPDERVRAVIAIGPWGMNTGFWDAEGLSGIQTPIFLMAGTIDDVSGYENGVRRIFEEISGVERYLLSFENANHNAAATIPAPAESYAHSETLGWAPFDHYADPVWDTVRMNNIAQHFTTAFFDLHLKQDEDKAAYLELVEDASQGVVALDDDGEPTDEHSYWRGFAPRTAVGLSLLRAGAEE